MLADLPKHSIIVIRHGQTDWNAARRLQGREDIPLNAIGRSQAARHGEALKARLARTGEDPSAWDFLASPLLRARETMRLMREAAGLDPLAFRTDPALMETDFGEWSGLLDSEIAARDPEGWHRRAVDTWNHVPPGGEGSPAIAARLRPILAAVDRPTVIVTHGGVNRVLKVLLGIMSIAESNGYQTPQDRFYVWSGGRVDWI